MCVSKYVLFDTNSLLGLILWLKSEIGNGQLQAHGRKQECRSAWIMRSAEDVAIVEMGGGQQQVIGYQIILRTWLAAHMLST